MKWLKYLQPWSMLGSSCATVFGIKVYGHDRPKWHPIWWVAWVGRRLDDMRYWLRSRLIPKYQYHLVRTGLKPGYYDEDYRMLCACMTLLCQYVDWHGGPDALDNFNTELRADPDHNAPDGLGSGQITTQSEAVAIYRWWKVERPANHQRHDDMLHRMYANTRMTSVPVQMGSETLHEYTGTEHVGADLRLPGDTHEALWALDHQNDEDDQRMLHRLIDIRPGLWT